MVTKANASITPDMQAKSSPPPHWLPPPSCAASQKLCLAACVMQAGDFRPDDVDIKVQQAASDPSSPSSYFHRLLRWRESHAFLQTATQHSLSCLTPPVYGWVRIANVEDAGMLCIFNSSPEIVPFVLPAPMEARETFAGSTVPLTTSELPPFAVILAEISGLQARAYANTH